MNSIRRAPLLALVGLLAAIPLLSGCLTKSTTVGDQFSGTVIVAATPGLQSGTPSFDVPASMGTAVSVRDFPGKDDGSDDKKNDDPLNGKVGSQLTFYDLTAGQFSQLGEIVSSALDSGATVDLSATRSGDVVRLRGGASLTGLSNQYFITITVDFDGPVVATNGNQTAEKSVTWAPEAGQNAEFIADAKYDDPATAALPSWTLFMLFLCVLVVVIVGWVAYRARDRSLRPGRPSKSDAGEEAGSRGRFGRSKKKDDDAAPDRPTAESASSPKS
ncbi:MAG: hypothetical protein QM658_02825 [Gordonia sp. (in: high G+C Gram-positive bacteria)]